MSPTATVKEKLPNLEITGDGQIQNNQSPRRYSIYANNNNNNSPTHKKHQFKTWNGGIGETYVVFSESDPVVWREREIRNENQVMNPPAIKKKINTELFIEWRVFMQNGGSRNERYREGGKSFAHRNNTRREWETITAACFKMTLMGMWWELAFEYC